MSSHFADNREGRVRRRALLPAIYCGLGVNRKKVFFRAEKRRCFCFHFCVHFWGRRVGGNDIWWNEEESCLAPIDGEREERKGRDGKV